MNRIIFLLLGLLILGACSESTPNYPRRSPPPQILTDAGQIGAGENLFRKLCASCHGSLAEGSSLRANFFEPPASDFRNPRYQRLDPAYLYWRIETGKNAEPFRSRGSVMPAWPTLQERQIWQLVAYLRSRSGN